MDTELKKILWSQICASIETMENAVRACPVEVWSNSQKPEWNPRGIVGFWYLAWHTAFWLDFYMTDLKVEFAPPEPLDLREMGSGGLLPDLPYDKDVVLSYLAIGRGKAHVLLESTTDQMAPSRRKGLGIAELFIYNIRHIQHHSAQMNLILRQKVGSAPDWVSKGKAPFLQTNNS